MEVRFYVEPPKDEGMKVSANGFVTLPGWPPYGKTFKVKNKRVMTLELGMQHLVLKYHQIYPNDDHGFTLTHFTARSDLVPLAYVWEIA